MFRFRLLRLSGVPRYAILQKSGVLNVDHRLNICERVLVLRRQKQVKHA